MICLIAQQITELALIGLLAYGQTKDFNLYQQIGKIRKVHLMSVGACYRLAKGYIFF